MSVETTTAPTGPTAGVAAVTFGLADPGFRPAGVRLVQDVPFPGGSCEEVC